MKRFTLTLAVCALISTPLLASGDDWDDNGDAGFPSHASMNEVREVLERQGFTNIVLADRNRLDRLIDVLATNPDGERVEIRLDNTTNIIRIRPHQ